jgi:hypothetical protein
LYTAVKLKLTSDLFTTYTTYVLQRRATTSEKAQRFEVHQKRARFFL